VAATDPSPDGARPARTRARAAFVALALVLCGVVIGAVADRLLLLHRHQLMPHGAFDPPASRIVDRLAHDLDLSASQRTTVAEIVRRHHDRVSALWGNVRPQLHSEMAAAQREIDAVLTPQQREKFHRLPHPRRFRPFGP
jgi:Spy/CpxP family protein refolding chaperone